MFHVPHHTHDRHPPVTGGVAAVIQALADGALARPEVPGKRLVDDGDTEAAVVIRRKKIASLEQRSADRLEIPGRHAASIGDEDRLAGLRLLAFGDHVVLRIARRERNAIRRGDDPDTGNRAHPIEQRAVEGPHDGSRIVLGIGKGHAPHEDIFRPIPEVEVREMPIAAQQQAGPRQQHERQRELRDHEAVADAAHMASARAACPALDRVLQIRSGNAQGGDESTEHAGQDRDARRKREDDRIEPHSIDPRELPDRKVTYQPDAPGGQQ